ncbi:MAG: MmgE/PrpD family protein [Betaproteobacteria bacterium]|nr:MmgE/PrpD family protein [Betaproteobacteria bacterium]
MADETRELAKFAAGFTYDQIPARVRSLALDLIVDQLGVEIGCSEMPWAKQVREVYRRNGGTPEATVVRYGERLPASSAALINSTFGHSFEYDDANPLTHGHLGAELVPSLMAIGEREHSSGRNFLTALVAAYEVRGRIGWAVSPNMLERGGPQYSTTCGPFGVATGVGKLLGLDAEGIRNALGVAGTFSGGLMQYDHGGGSVKRLFTAIGASSGIQAAHLAQGGITGPEGILEGARGLLRIYPSDYQPERLVADFGKQWMIDHLLFKPYSCCALIHPAIDALKKIITANDLKADGIESIEVGYPKGFYDHAAITSPKDLLGMQFSTSYTLAITVLKGRNTPREYTMEVLVDARIRALASKVRLWEDLGLDKYFEGHMPARVKVRTTSGAVHEELVIDAKGSMGAPFSSDEVDDKFRSQVADVFGAERCEKLLGVLRNIDTLDDVAKLPPMLVVKNGK